jgi:GNAT superfamily N-acetyltransferase
MTDASWQVRRVYGDDALEAIDILHEASRWTSTFGQPIWLPESFTVEEQRDLAAAGEQIGGFEDSKMVACMRLQKTDRIFWPDDPPGEALYVHKLAVRRASSGKGWTARMIDWAKRECCKENAPALRLDTAANTKLPQFYEKLGFRLIEEPPLVAEGMLIVRMQLWIDAPR